MARPVATDAASAARSSSPRSAPIAVQKTTSPPKRVQPDLRHTPCASWYGLARRVSAARDIADVVATTTRVVLVVGAAACGGSAGAGGTGDPPVSDSPSSVNTSPTGLRTT